MTTKEVDLTRVCGLGPDGKQAPLDRTKAQTIIALKLAAAGYQVPPALVDKNAETLELASDLFRVYREQSRLLQSTPCPIDQRIQAYLNDVLSTTGDEIPQLPSTHLAVDRYGIAKELSFPLGKDEYHNSEIDSYRLSNGVLHNPLNDKRTTAGVFHVADYGLPIPADKIPVPLKTYGRLLAKALQPPEDLNTIAYTSEWEKPVVTMVSLHLRPLVCPEVPGVSPEKRSEVRFFVPGSCTANLDFVENIFGNGGDSRLPENDAGLDTEHWTGTTGCVILAPHLRKQLKKEMGLPHVSEATEKQKANGMCWSDPNELYNGGSPFKITCRDERGIMVTILADNYFGYCKKEVKTQIGLSANIFGVAEEEHAGGALAFKAVNLGEHFKANPRYMQTIVPKKAKKFVHTFEEAMSLLGDTVTIHPEGYATDNKFNDIHFLPEDMELNVQTQTAKFTDKKSGELRSIRLLPNHTYVHPCGYKVLVNKHPTIPKWKLTGVLSEPTFCHKPSTVSGGGKSEISKSLTDAVIHGPIFIGNYEEDMAIVEKIVNRDYSNCLLPEYKADHSDPSRPILSMERTLGSVIKLLTPDDIYTEEHNKFLESIPSHIFAILFAIKSNYKADMGSEWRKHFTVDITNGSPGHELKFQNRQLVGSYLRVGFSQDGTWRNYKMRQDFIAASKVQMEDDITASVVVPREQLKNIPEEYARYPSLKISRNCEWRLFQRPDDAIHPGYDTLTEFDMASPDLFCSNFQPLRKEEMKYLSEEMYFFDKMTKPMQKHMTKAKTYDGFNVCSAKPRMVDGAPTKNPRYLQVRPDVNFPKDKYLAELGARLYRRMSVDEPVVFPVAGVLSGRRNNPPDELNGKKIRPLCVFNPLHYQELPELLMDYVCCVTGKSPNLDGSVFDSSVGKDPLEVEVGASQVVPGFEAALRGMRVGENVTVSLPPEKAYGQRREDFVFKIPATRLPPDLQVGAQVTVGAPGGQRIPVVLTDLTPDGTAVLDANPPLAGKTLIFDIKLVGFKQPPKRGVEMVGWQGKTLQVPIGISSSRVSQVFDTPTFPASWPYKESDFSRQDESDDGKFYNTPRFVTHIDDGAIGAIRDFYALQFAKAPQGEYSVLDICSSWISHYPKDLRAKRVAITGMVEKELEANKQATEFVTKNLNQDPKLPFGDSEFDFVTNVVSVDYLSRPREIFQEVHRVMKPGGVAIMSFSNRCFPSKAISMWVKNMNDGPGHCQIVGNYFHFCPPGGWKSISSVDISPDPGRSDPMWVVTAVKA